VNNFETAINLFKHYLSVEVAGNVMEHSNKPGDLITADGSFVRISSRLWNNHFSLRCYKSGIVKTGF